MKKFILPLICFLFLACTSDKETNATTENFTFKHIVTEKNSEESIVYTQEFIIDNDGKVVQEKFQSIFIQIKVLQVLLNTIMKEEF